jgi:hypothetical protein
VLGSSARSAAARSALGAASGALPIVRRRPRP